MKNTDVLNNLSSPRIMAEPAIWKHR